MKKKSNLSRLLGYAGRHRRLTVLGCTLSGIAAVLGLVPYVCVWLVAREALSGYPAVPPAQALTHWGWMAVWFAVGNIAVYFAALMCTHVAAFRTARNMRHAGVAHVLELPLGFFSGDQSGRLRKIIDDNAALTEDLLAHKLPDLTAAVVTPAAIVLLFVFDWRMGLLCLLTMVLALGCMMSMMGGKNAGFFHRYQQEIEKMSGEAVEYGQAGQNPQEAHQRGQILAAQIVLKEIDHRGRAHHIQSEVQEVEDHHQPGLTGQGLEVLFQRGILILARTEERPPPCRQR